MRILLVEDQDILRRVLARSLRVRGRVDEADRLYPALDALGRRLYDVVIADEVLPDGSGRDLLTRVSQTQTRCRRVLMSGVDVPKEREPTPSYERFFRKPDELVALIHWLDAIRS